MTGRDLLEEIKRSRQHLLILRDELREQRATLEGIRAVVYDGIHVACGGIPKDVADGIAAIEKKKLEICSEWADLVDKRLKAQRIISAIPRQDYKDILTERYTNGKRWVDIAAVMRYDASWLFRLHTRALREFDKIYARENSP